MILSPTFRNQTIFLIFFQIIKYLANFLNNNTNTQLKIYSDIKHNNTINNQLDLLGKLDWAPNLNVQIRNRKNLHINDN